jgi:hypothetical protein
MELAWFSPFNGGRASSAQMGIAQAMMIIASMPIVPILAASIEPRLSKIAHFDCPALVEN